MPEDDDVEVMRQVPAIDAEGTNLRQRDLGATTELMGVRGRREVLMGDRVPPVPHLRQLFFPELFWSWNEVSAVQKRIPSRPKSAPRLEGFGLP